jgi:two-component system chemotaxis response regulator CheV
MNNSFIKSVDQRTQLAGANRLEVLLFSLGEDVGSEREEVYGINVFKVREVMHVPEITRAPDMPDAVEGMVSLRGTMVPVINLPKFCGMATKRPPKILMITEYNKHVQGFLVHSVETIERLSWDDIKTPPPMITSRMGGLVTAVAELQDKRLVMIMDVEKVLAETASFYDEDLLYSEIEPVEDRELHAFFADDSSVARKQIASTLDRMRIRHMSAVNGAEAWKMLKDIADRAGATGRKVSDYIQFILTDVEMPEMDGYVLTRKIKEDQRFNGIPVIMHSSLTSEANQALGKGVGADAYVPKFEPRELAAIVAKMVAAD